MSTTEKKTQAALEDLRDHGLDAPIDPDITPDRTRKFRTPGFAVMRTDFDPESERIIKGLKSVLENRLMSQFPDIYEVLGDLYAVVRVPVTDPVTGEQQFDNLGRPLYERTEFGSYREDWSNLTRSEKEHFLFLITTRLVEWRQQAADSWTEAMFAKAQWEERFAIGFAESGGRTDETRTQAGQRDAIEERYLGIFKSAYAKKAKALVDAMDTLQMRLKDTLD